MKEKILAEIKGVRNHRFGGYRYYNLVFTEGRIMGGYIGASAAYPMPVNAFLIEKRIKKTSPKKLWEESFKENKHNFSIDYNNIEEVRITKERIWPKFRLKLTQKDEIVGNKPLFTFSSESREDLNKKVETVESIFMKMMPTRTIVIDKL